jgi:hypothetical protein
VKAWKNCGVEGVSIKSDDNKVFLFPKLAERRVKSTKTLFTTLVLDCSVVATY